MGSDRPDGKSGVSGIAVASAGVQEVRTGLVSGARYIGEHSARQNLQHRVLPSRSPAACGSEGENCAACGSDGCCCDQQGFAAADDSWQDLDHGESLSSQRYSRRRIHKVARVSEIKGREELHETLCVRIHQQHSCLLQVRAKQRWIWLKSIRLLKHLLLLLLHHHHLAGVSPCKKIQRLKRLCRSSAIRAVMMEKL
jgi:hypothetical protein